MSSPRHNWWGYALNIIRDYPAYQDTLDALREQNITATATGLPRGGGVSRTTEGVAMRVLPREQRAEYDAVCDAIKRAKMNKEAKLYMSVVTWNLWRGHKIRDTAVKLYISESTARLYRWDFVMWVGIALEKITEQEYQHERKKKLRSKKFVPQSQKNVLS